MDEQQVAARCSVGRNSHVDLRSACNLFRVVYQLRRDGRCVWKDAVYSPLLKRLVGMKAPWLAPFIKAKSSTSTAFALGGGSIAWSRVVAVCRHEVADVGDVGLPATIRRCDFDHICMG